MWFKHLAIILLFYFFAILQNSFLVHFNIFGIVPNLVLVLCFLLIFFSENYFYALIAGFFLDIFSHFYFGISIISLLIAMFLIKKALQHLWNKTGQYAVFYFLPLFAVYLIIYNGLFNIGLFFLSPAFSNFNINLTSVISLAYNMAFALLGFYICKKFNLFKDSDRQLKLF